MSLSHQTLRFPVLALTTLTLSLAACGDGASEKTSVSGSSEPAPAADAVLAAGTDSPQTSAPEAMAQRYDYDALLARLSGEDLEDGREHLADAADERADARKNRDRAAKERDRARDARERATDYAGRGDSDRAAEEEERARKAEERALKDLERAAKNEKRALEEERRLVRLVARATDDAALLAQVRTDDIRAGNFPIDAYGVKRAKITYRLEGLIEGTQTLYIDDWGATVAMVTDAAEQAGQRKEHYLWTDGRAYFRDIATGRTWSSALRAKDSEPTSFAITKAKDLERVGYKRQGEKTIAGKTCEHWVHEEFSYDGCRWKRVELEFANGVLIGANAGLKRTATEVVEGAAIPPDLLALAQETR